MGELIALGSRSTPTTVISADGAKPRVIVGFNLPELRQALALDERLAKEGEKA